MRLRVLVLCALSVIGGLAALAARSSSASAASGTLTIVGPWQGADQQAFEAVLAGFTQANPGVTVTYTHAAGDVATAVQGTPGNPPDLAVLSLPQDQAALKTMASIGVLKSLDFALPAMKAHYAYSWQALASNGGTLFGVPFKATNRSAVWFDRATFRKAGIAAPRSWAELRRAIATLSARGIAPFALSGGSVSLPSLFENVYLMLDGSTRYDKLAAGRISWTGTTVRDALAMTAHLTSGLAGGLNSLSSTDYSAAVKKVFGTPVRAAMVPGGSAALPVLYSAKAVRRLNQFGVFAFPRINGDAPRVIGDADVVVMTKASTAAEALVTYLASPEAATIWAKRGGFYLSPNRDVAPSSYGDPAIRNLATTLAAANVFRLGLDASMPATLSATYDRMLVQYVRNPAAAGALLAQLNAGSGGSK